MVSAEFVGGVGRATLVGTALVLAAAAGCGGDGTTSSGLVEQDASTDDAAEAGTEQIGPNPVPPGPPVVRLQGGSALAPGGQAAAGGALRFVALGGITLDPALSVAATDIPAPPADALALTSPALSANVSTDGAVVIDGTVESSGTDAVREIVAGGDIFVRGTLRAADLGGGRQGLSLRSTAGKVYVTGILDLSGAPGTGQAAGALAISAQGVAVSGALLTAGGSGTTQGGAAGAVSITSSGALWLLGLLDASGGDVPGVGAAVGGAGGDLKLQAGGDVVLGGTALVRGGAASTDAADATGGPGGHVVVDSDGTVTFAGMLDGSGGTARAGSAGGVAAAGAAGTLTVGEGAPPTDVLVLVPLLLLGGHGDALGGDGGSVLLEPHAKDLHVAGTLDVSGGNSKTQPGAGGTIEGYPGPDGGAGIVISGQIITNGGSVAPGGTGNGADGGLIKLEVLSLPGGITLAESGVVQVDGGKSGGTGTAGGGGRMYLFTQDGNGSFAGKLLARGGDAPDDGGSGGLGGFVYLFTDNNHTGEEGGNLILETTGLIDASGGDGTNGGSARNDGIAGSVARWPVGGDKYNVLDTAVLFNSDGRSGPASGYQENRGTIVARGGRSNGSGGDIQFHGRGPDGDNTPPLPGNLDMSGDGTGGSGDWAAE